MLWRKNWNSRKSVPNMKSRKKITFSRDSRDDYDEQEELMHLHQTLPFVLLSVMIMAQFEMVWSRLSSTKSH